MRWASVAIVVSAPLDVALRGLSIADGTLLQRIRTSPSESAAVVWTLRVDQGHVVIPLQTGTVFTVTEGEVGGTVNVVGARGARGARGASQDRPAR